MLRLIIHCLLLGLLVSCNAPTVAFTNYGLAHHTLKGRTLAIGGFAVSDFTTYPGQV